MISLVGRGIEGVRISLFSTMVHYLEECLECNMWPSPPQLRCIPPSKYDRTLVFLLSIDSGTGTTKIMGKFVSKFSTQKWNEVLLLGQSR